MLTDEELMGLSEPEEEEETTPTVGKVPESNEDESILTGETDEDEDIEDEVIEEEEDEEETYTVKVDDEDVEVSLEELQRGYSHASQANKKFRDAAFARKQAEEFINLLKTDPWAVLNDPSLGIDTKNMAKEYLEKQLQYDQLSDDEKELQSARLKLSQYETDRRASEQTEYDRQMGELTQTYTDQYSAEIEAALTEDGLPVTKATVQRMAGYMSDALASDDPSVRSLTAADITELVREDYASDFKSMFGTADAETLEAILGSDLAKTLRKADVKKLTNRNTKTKKPVKEGKQAKVKKSTAFNQDTFDNFLDSY